MYQARRTCVALALSLSFLVPTVASGFSSQGNRWPNQAGAPVLFRIDPVGSEDIGDESDREAMRRAFSTWDSVACSYLEFEEAEWTSPAIVGNDSTNRLFFVERAADWPGQPATIALTFTFFRTADQVITDADIVINGANWAFTTVDADIGTGTPAKLDLETVIFHEIGHFFGLDHSQDTAAAMYPSNNKQKQRGPAPDDINGVCSLYPNGEPIPNNPNPSGLGPVGAPCQRNADCASSMCAQDNLIHRSYCTAQCNLEMPTSCPAGYECQHVTQGDLCLAPASVDELCDQCDVGGQCASGLCINVPGINNYRPFCSKACDPTPGQPAVCPQGYFCEEVGGAARGACSPNTGVCEPKGKGGQGEICYANGSCKPGFTCVDYFPGASSDLRYCYFSCALEFFGASCGGGTRTRCLGVSGLENIYVCYPEGSVGEPCIPEICDDTSYCAYDDAAGVDSALCYQVCSTGACPTNEQCLSFEGLPNLCVPNAGFKRVGDACQSDSECLSRTCRTYGQSRLCTEQCASTDAASCGPGLKCIAPVGSVQGLCWPESFTDFRATEPGRSITVATYCGCDSSIECDADCACDPECLSGGGCGCTSTLGERGTRDDRGTSGDRETPGGGHALFLLFVLALGSRLRFANAL